MINLSDIIAANNLLISLGGEDQLPKIAASAIEKSLDLQHKVDRALSYAAEAPSNSMHAKQMARILDGSITLDDEANEIREQHPHPSAQPRLQAVTDGGKRKRKSGGPGSRNSGLSGRRPHERKAFRAWAEEQDFDIPTTGPVPQKYVDAYDEAMAARHNSGGQSRMLL